MPHTSMSLVERPLGNSSAVPGGCGRCVFTGCRDVPTGWLLALSVWGSPAGDVPVAFRDADGEVRFPGIYIMTGGSLRAVLQNRWEGEDGSCGYYSLLPHAEVLGIADNPRAVRDLAAYTVGGTRRSARGG